MVEMRARLRVRVINRVRVTVQDRVRATDKIGLELHVR